MTEVTTLTPRQREIAALIARGWSNQQIARELVLTPGSVANHVARIMKKLGFSSRAQIASWAMEQGLGPTQDRLLTTLERLLEIEVTTLKAAMDAVAQLVADALGAAKVDAWLHDPVTDTLVTIGASDTPLAEQQRATGLDRLPVANGGRIVHVFLTGEPYLSGRVDRDPEELVGVRQRLGIRSAVAVPLEVAGQRRGVLSAWSAAPDFFSARDLRFLEAVARWVGSLAHRAELAERNAAAAAEQGRRAAAEELVRVLARNLRQHLTQLERGLELICSRARREHRRDYLHDAEEMARTVDRLGRSIAHLLDAARIQQGLLAINPRPLDLAALVRETAETFRSPDVPIRVRTPEELPISADPGRLRQVLENLLTNARRHSPKGQPVAVEITAETRDGARWAVVTVTDRGPGVPPEVLPRLFELFSAGPGCTGFGLGLYLASQIAAAHGGTLTMESPPDGGATFRLALPAESV